VASLCSATAAGGRRVSHPVGVDSTHAWATSGHRPRRAGLDRKAVGRSECNAAAEPDGHPRGSHAAPNARRGRFRIDPGCVLRRHRPTAVGRAAVALDASASSASARPAVCAADALDRRRANLSVGSPLSTDPAFLRGARASRGAAGGRRPSSRARARGRVTDAGERRVHPPGSGCARRDLRVEQGRLLPAGPPLARFYSGFSATSCTKKIPCLDCPVTCFRSG
jgi:hypothetical protein